MPKTDKFIDLGNGHSYVVIFNKTNQPCGIIEKHHTSAGVPCQGFVGFAGVEGGRGSTGRGPTWKVESYDPLTLSPSIQCSACGEHGYISNGRWVSA